jgi:hypothetical protein
MAEINRYEFVKPQIVDIRLKPQQQLEKRENRTTPVEQWKLKDEK